MIKEILNNRFFVLILYLIGILYFIKINPYLFPNLKIKNSYNQIVIFVTLIIIMVLSHYNTPLGLFGALILLYFLIVKNLNYSFVISENFYSEERDDDEKDEDDDDEKDEEDDDEEDDNDNDDDDDDDDKEEEDDEDKTDDQ